MAVTGNEPVSAANLKTLIGSGGGGLLATSSDVDKVTNGVRFNASWALATTPPKTVIGKAARKTVTVMVRNDSSRIPVNRENMSDTFLDIDAAYLPTVEGKVGSANASASKMASTVSFTASIMYTGGKFVIDKSNWDELYSTIYLYDFNLTWQIAESATKKEDGKLVTLGLLMEVLAK
jgi:hypothetical protein|nr:MAG TPA: hypothetical protein [Caudoviricetes sp.]